MINLSSLDKLMAAKWRLLVAKLRGSLKSLTVWFNGVMAAAPAALLYAQDQLPMLRDYLPLNLYGYAFGATVLGNLALRFFRRQDPLEDK